MHGSMRGAPHKATRVARAAGLGDLRPAPRTSGTVAPGMSVEHALPTSGGRLGSAVTDDGAGFDPCGPPAEPACRTWRTAWQRWAGSWRFGANREGNDGQRLGTASTAGPSRRNGLTEGPAESHPSGHQRPGGRSAWVRHLGGGEWRCRAVPLGQGDPPVARLPRNPPVRGGGSPRRRSVDLRGRGPGSPARSLHLPPS